MKCPEHLAQQFLLREMLMMSGHWRDRTATVFACQKRPASGSRGVVVSPATAWCRPNTRRRAYTTHMTAADASGNVVATTQTINHLFGAKFLIPGLGVIPNNYMNLFSSRPGHALSLAPGKRVTTSMSPMMALRDGVRLVLR
jgi:gamma-glutamyltranspeptidase